MAQAVLYAADVRCLASLLITCVVAATGRHAYCETAARPPSTIVAALVDGDPANDDVEAAAQAIADALHLERISQARAWQDNVRDDFASPRVNELADAMREVYELCPGAIASDMMTPYDRNRLEQAAATLAQAAGEEPSYRGTVSTMPWQSYLLAAQHGAECVSRRQPPEHVKVSVFAAGDRRWTLYANGVDAGEGIGNDTIDVLVQPRQTLYLHARCVSNIRCSRTIEVRDARAVGVYIDAVGSRLRGRMAESTLAISYASEADRNRLVALDGALTAYVLAAAGKPRGDAISVMREGPDVRLVYSNEDGAAVATLRVPRERVAEAARRLVDGDSEPAAGAWQPGKHRVVVDTKAGAPEVISMQSSFDRTLVPARAFCKAGRCAFAAPTGHLRMRFDEDQWSGPLEKRVNLDKDLLVTVTPGKRYWAKYTGFGMMTLGGASMLAAVLSGGLNTALANGVCEAVPGSGPRTCDEHVPATAWETAAFFGGLGTVGVGAFLYLVVHKKPRINVAPLGGVGLAF